MKSQLPHISQIKKEVEISTARSGGPGGQHVNKVETKVLLKWNVNRSTYLTADQKEKIAQKLANKLNKEGELLIMVDSTRSQLKNKTLAFKKLERLVRKAFQKEKKRIATKPSKAVKARRVDDKKKHGEKKAMRKKIL